MIRFRPFRNSDPPLLVDIWRSQPPLRGLMQPMSTMVLEQLVLSKPYFDRDGLIVAEEGDKLIGFVHAGFGPNEDRSDIFTATGVTCLLLVSRGSAPETLHRELLAQSEAYLLRHGATTLQGGGYAPYAPFYLGLYGGCQLPGVLNTDALMLETYRQSGYKQAVECAIMQRELSNFRPPVDRRQMQLRRQYNVEAAIDYPCGNWWDACTIGQADPTCYRLVQRTGGVHCGQAVLWDMEPMARGWGVHAMGVIKFEIEKPLRGGGLGTFLISEAMRQLQANGVSMVEVQIEQKNASALGLFRKLGFEQVDQGCVFRKVVASSAADENVPSRM